MSVLVFAPMGKVAYRFVRWDEDGRSVERSEYTTFACDYRGVFAVMATSLVLALHPAVISASDPREPVHRFLVPRSASDACAQLTPRYRRQLDRQYGPCVQAIKANPPAKQIHFWDVRIRGAHASLRVRYVLRGQTLRELYVLVLSRRRWLIDGARRIG